MINKALRMVSWFIIGAAALLQVVALVVPALSNASPPGPPWLCVGAICLFAGIYVNLRSKKSQAYAKWKLFVFPILALVCAQLTMNNYGEKRNSALKFLKETGLRVDRICKEAGKCPDKLEGLVCDDYNPGYRSIYCKGVINGFNFDYSVRPDEDDPESDKFMLQLRQGYARHYVQGGVKKKLVEGFNPGS